jgi:Tfp pilus assembly protein PilV
MLKTASSAVMVALVLLVITVLGGITLQVYSLACRARAGLRRQRPC